MTRTAAALGSAAFLLLAPGTIAGLVPWWITGWAVQAPLLGVGAVRGVGMVLLAAGVLALLECFVRFALQGRGTPAPVAPTETLVASGLYRHVRNPMYVAVVAIIAGQALWLGSAALLAYGALVWAAFHAFVLAYEEPTLRRRHPQAYATFCAAVPRWIPRLTPWRP